MATYEILTAPKVHDEAALRAALAKERPGFKIEALVDKGNEWHIRIADDDEDSSDSKKPPFLKEKKDDSDSSSDDSSSDSSDESDDSDDDSDGDSEDGDKKGNPAEKVKGVIDQLTSLFTELGGHVDELQASHDEKDQKLKDIADTAGEGEGGPDAMPEGPLPPDLKDMSEGPGGPPKPPRAAPVPGGARRHGPGAPPPGGGIPTFTHKTEIAHHPGVDTNGNRLSLAQVTSELETDDEFEGYEVIALSANRDGTFSAKLAKKR